jgi:hypothetical protein
MADVTLTQALADALIALEKRRVDDTRHVFPDQGSITIPLLSADKREAFVLDIRNGGIDLAKATYQNRTRQVIVLVRLDLGDKPHTNPDGEQVSSPHLHLYREGFADKWAVPLPKKSFGNPKDKWRSLQDFMKYCNITLTPCIDRGLFV